MESRVEAVSKMQAYILEHLEEALDLAAMTAVAGYSLWHGVRLFRKWTGLSPAQYQRALRLTDAAKSLRDGREKVLDVALDAGFDSHEGFTRAFHQRFSLSPSAYRQIKPAIPFFLSYPVHHAYHAKHTQGEKNHMNTENVSRTVTVTLVPRPERKLVYLPSMHATDYMSYCEEKGCDWEGLLDSIPESLDAPALLQLPTFLERPGASAWAAGVELPAAYQKPMPEGWLWANLPPVRMLYFQGMPFAREDDYALAIQIVQEAIDGYDPKLLGVRYARSLAPCFNFGASAALGARMALPVTDL